MNMLYCRKIDNIQRGRVVTYYVNKRDKGKEIETV